VLKAKWKPTALTQPGVRAPVELAPARRPGPFRTIEIIAFVLATACRGIGAVIRRKLRLPLHSRRRGERIRRGLERLGGLWIKAGQLLALRRDLLSSELCDELARLHDRAVGFPPADVVRVLEAELERPVSEVFSEFDRMPLAAASVGQTHRARLRRNGMLVAVKVQRPTIAETFHRDFRYLRWIVSFLRRFDIAPNGRWRDMLWELQRTMRQELDYRLEAASIQRMKRSLRPHRVYVPKVAN